MNDATLPPAKFIAAPNMNHIYVEVRTRQLPTPSLKVASQTCRSAIKISEKNSGAEEISWESLVKLEGCHFHSQFSLLGITPLITAPEEFTCTQKIGFVRSDGMKIGYGPIWIPFRGSMLAVALKHQPLFHWRSVFSAFQWPASAPGMTWKAVGLGHGKSHQKWRFYCELIELMGN